MPRPEPTLESCTIEAEGPAEEGAQQPVRIVLRGSGFRIGGKDPKIKVGDVEVKRFQIMSDECTIIAYLDERPEEGATVSVDYGLGRRAELSEGLSRAEGDEG